MSGRVVGFKIRDPRNTRWPAQSTIAGPESQYLLSEVQGDAWFRTDGPGPGPGRRAAAPVTAASPLAAAP